MTLLQTIYWEAEYETGSISEARGARYKDIDRARLTLFRVRDNEGPLVELPVEHGRTGWNLVYRRRTTIYTVGEMRASVIYLLGWVPQGPILAIDSTTYQIYQAEAFVSGDPIFYPPVPNPAEGERWAIANPAKIINPAAEKTTSF